MTPADTAGFQGYVLGSETAPVTITEYADYQCPACQSFEMVEFPYVKERLIQTGQAPLRLPGLPARPAAPLGAAGGPLRGLRQ